MSDSMQISGPVTVRNDSRERVALDLMTHIGINCYHKDQDEQRTREYWLNLYHECHQATLGRSLERIQDKK